jgi:hypothetical protein
MSRETSYGVAEFHFVIRFIRLIRGSKMFADY